MVSKTVKKLTFTWQGTNTSRQQASGEINAVSLRLAKALLRQQGISPTKVRKKQRPLFSTRKKHKATAEDITLFIRQMTAMIKAGVPLVQSFSIVANSVDNLALKQLINTIKMEITAGSNFANALRQHPRYFDELTCNLIESGEQSGTLEAMLARLATYKEKSDTLKRKIKKALIYPIAVILIAMIVSSILLLKVVPTFAEIFQGFGAELPAFTQWIINLSTVLQTWWHLLITTIIIFIFAFREAKFRSKKVCYALDKWVLKAPIIGNILIKSIYARFSRTLSTTFAAGIPLVEALTSTAKTAGNSFYAKAFNGISEEVATGQSVHLAMHNTGLFPEMIIQMTAIGEASGALDEMLGHAAQRYEEQVGRAVDNLTTLMEPVIMSVLGVVIGGLIIAMYLPIFKMGSVV